MKIAYCGYDFFSASLRGLLQAGMSVYRLFTVPNRGSATTRQYMFEIAGQYLIPISDERITPSTLDQLKQEGCDLLITAAYNYKIPPLEATGIRGINVHPTLLPQGRGEWPLPWVILTEQKISGITIHKLTDEYDAGDILLQKSFTVDNDETLETLSAKSQMLASHCLPEAVENLETLWNNAAPQKGEVSHWGIPSAEQRRLDWNKNVEELERICRAFGKFGCDGFFDGQNWTVYLLKGWLQEHHYEPGVVVHKTSTEMIVAAKDGLVSLVYFQKKQPAAN